MLRGAIDYWCNGFTATHQDAWEAAIANQGLSLKVHRDGDEFCDAATMVDRLDQTGFASVVLIATDLEPDAPINSFERVEFRAEEIAALATTYPGRFVGQWSIDPTTGANGVRRADELLREPWCVGLHNHTHSWDRRFDHPDFTPYYELCTAHDVPFVMQAGASGGDFPHECGHPDAIAAPATEFADVRFVLSHTGAPWEDETIAAARRFPNVYVGTATWPPRRWSDALVDFASTDGRGKVLYGSGFPTTGHRQAARQLPARIPDPDVVELLTSATARSVFTRLP